MSITTNILANGHSSTIVNLIQPKVRANYFKKSDTVDQPDIYDPAFVQNENAFLSLIQFFKTSKIANAVFFRFVPAGNLAYKERLVLQFSLTKRYAPHFALLRGLLEFGKFTGIAISTDAINKTFELEISSAGAKNALPYFKTIFFELLREAAFKSALNKVILVQREVAKIQQQSLDGLFTSLSNNH